MSCSYPSNQIMTHSESTMAYERSGLLPPLCQQGSTETKETKETKGEDVEHIYYYSGSGTGYGVLKSYINEYIHNYPRTVIAPNPRNTRNRSKHQ